MKLVLDIIKSADEISIIRNFHLNKISGTIGRSDSADWQLIDKENYISNTHLYIEYQDEVYFIRDESTNGTYTKFPYKKLPKGNRVKINSTDVFVIGDYEIQARFVEDDFSTAMIDQINTSETQANTLIPDDDFLDEPFDSLETNELNVMDIVSNQKQTNYENTISKGEIESDTNASELNEHHINITGMTQENIAPEATIEDTSLERSINVLEKKLGIKICSLDKPQRDAIMQEIGDIVVNSLSGLKHSLYIKEKIKEDLDALQTNEKETKVNPILLGKSAAALLQNKETAEMLGFAKVSDAVLQSFDELDQHNIALHATSKNLMNVVMRKFSPTNLKYYFESKGSLKSLFRRKKSMMWKAYEMMFNELEQKPGEAAKIISEDFSQEYKSIAFSVTLATKERI